LGRSRLWPLHPAVAEIVEYYGPGNRQRNTVSAEVWLKQTAQTGIAQGASSIRVAEFDRGLARACN